MIEVSKVKVYGWQAAIRGMRNSYNSWDKSDSVFGPHEVEFNDNHYEMVYNDEIGDADLTLMNKLFKAGPSHRKYLRYIHVQMDINAPLYWWKEYDTYKIGTAANSTSTMHKIADHKFTLDDFSHEHLDIRMMKLLKEIIDTLNDYRNLYINYDPKSFEIEAVPSKKLIWWQMIQMLPSSFNQLRTVDFNYEVLYIIINQRSNHKLDEWKEFVEKLKDLPYVKEIGGLK